MARIDPHSYFDTDQPRTKHVRLRWQVDFHTHQLIGDATLVFETPSCGASRSRLEGLDHHLSADAHRPQRPLCAGRPTIPSSARSSSSTLPAQTSEVTIAYRTSPEALALQWLDPAQTAGKRHPFLFSQCQAIHARTIVPLQDTPRARVTYDAEVTVPEPLTAVMSAGPCGQRPASHWSDVRVRDAAADSALSPGARGGPSRLAST